MKAPEIKALAAKHGDPSTVSRTHVAGKRLLQFVL